MLQELNFDANYFTLILTVGVVLFLPSIFAITCSKKREQDNSNIPWAPGSIPLLGHALAYKKDPGKFLLASTKAVGDIFQINLAGKRMVVACGLRTQRKVAMAPESVLSARQAIADIGFEQMLGPINVHKGTNLHKGIVKGMWHADADADEHVRLLIGTIQKALHRESMHHQSTTIKMDFMIFVRRVLLRTTIERFIGVFFLNGWSFDFVDAFMKFQDDLEDVTAKSVVLPKFLALPLLLWPLARRRLELQKIIAQRLRLQRPNPESSRDCGFWLASIQDDHSIDEIAELVVGLLFAAHKNPAIGAAQSFLMLSHEATVKERELCKQEAKILLQNPTCKTVRESCPMLNRLCLETLRLTAHSIGGLRTAKTDFVVGKGQAVAKGTTVALTHISSSLDSKIWKEPYKFIINSESKERSQELYDNEYTFSVFSHGIHKCPGQKLAVIMMQCTVALLLEEYEIEFVQPIPPIDFERATLAQRGGPVYFSSSKKEFACR